MSKEGGLITVMMARVSEMAARVEHLRGHYKAIGNALSFALRPDMAEKKDEFIKEALRLIDEALMEEA